MGFPLPNPVDPNYRPGPGDPNYGVDAFGAAWHDLWSFFTSIAQDLYATFRAIQSTGDGT